MIQFALLFGSLLTLHVNGYWLLLLNQDTENGGYFSNDIRTSGVKDALDPASITFSIIGAFDRNEFLNNGKYQFRLTYNDGEEIYNGARFDEIWTQTSWLTDSTITGSSVVAPDADCAHFRGLGLSDAVKGNGYASYLDGDADYKCGYYFHPVGVIVDEYKNCGGLPIGWPNFVNCATRVKLYVCPAGDCDSETEICDRSKLGSKCEADANCPNCMKCCGVNKVCERRVQFASAAAQSIVNNIDKNPSIYKTNEVVRPDYSPYGYIVLVGVIVFILINNIFIGFWCLRNTKKKQEYEKCDVNNE